MSKFKKAERKKARLRLGLTGTSGSGKTYSSLRLAKGLGYKTAVIDTEKGSASLYSNLFDFDVLELEAPFTTEKYIQALKDAQAEGYELVILDSISHAWAGEGGLLQQKEKLDSTGKGNSFANWAKMTPKQEQFISAIVQSPLHVIVTMRSKTEYAQQQEAGKTKIQKVGLAPVQRDGFEYELTTVFDVGSSHEAECSKDRTGLFVDQIFKITEETGKIIREWLESGKEPEKQEIKPPSEQKPTSEAPKEQTQVNTQPPKNEAYIKKEDWDTLAMAACKFELKQNDIKSIIGTLWVLESLKDMKVWQCEELLKMISDSKTREELDTKITQIVEKK